MFVNKCGNGFIFWQQQQQKSLTICLCALYHSQSNLAAQIRLDERVPQAVAHLTNLGQLRKPMHTRRTFYCQFMVNNIIMFKEIMTLR